MTPEIQLHPIQLAFHLSKALYRGFVGGRGSGKTRAGAYDLAIRSQPNCTYLVASPTYTIMEDTTLPTFELVSREMGLWESVKYTPRPNVRLKTGAVVRFRSAEDPDKLRGPNLSGCWLDEASLMEREAYDIVIASLREGGEQGWLSATFTPKGLTHWTYELFGRRNADGSPVSPNTQLFSARTRDNPFAPAGFHDQVALQYTGLRAAQELDGRFVAVEGAEWPAEYFPPSIWFGEYPAQRDMSALALDPALGKGEKQKACYAFFVYAAYCGGKVYVEAWPSQQWDSAQLVEVGLRLYDEKRPNGFGVETSGNQGHLCAYFREKSGNRPGFPLIPLDNRMEKIARIRARVGPFLARGELLFRDTPGTRLLMQQLRDFPMGEYVDGPDALEMALHVLVDTWNAGRTVQRKERLAVR